MNLWECVRFTSDGLIPAIAQDADDGTVLMMAWMNKDALEQTLRTRKGTYWSRSRQELWVKGATSGHTQDVVEVRTDCDQDVILLKVHQTGAACHEGYRACFFRTIDAEGGMTAVESRLVDPESVYGDQSP